MSFQSLRKGEIVTRVGVGEVIETWVALNGELDLLKDENARLREALEEMTKPPYKDSDLRSFVDWMNARARAVLEGK